MNGIAFWLLLAAMENRRSYLAREELPLAREEHITLFL
jgi:hypothetical protein